MPFIMRISQVRKKESAPAIMGIHDTASTATPVMMTTNERAMTVRLEIRK